MLLKNRFNLIIKHTQIILTYVFKSLQYYVCELNYLLTKTNIIKMKNIINFVLILTVIVNAWSCNAQNQNNNHDVINQKSEKMLTEPDELGMDREALDAAVQSASLSAIESNEEELTKEGLAAIDATIKARDAIKNGDTDVALHHIETAVGKIEVLLAREPELALIPISSVVRTEEFIGDIETIKAIKSKVQQSINEGKFQLAKNEISTLGSEVRIETTNIPTVSYPLALKASAALLDEGENDLALENLQSMLNTLMVTEKVFPLPIIKAEVMIKEALSIDKKSADNQKKIDQLLHNIEYQLLLSEELGYGKGHNEYSKLMDSIKTLRNSVNTNQDTKELFEDLKSKVENFKHGIS